ncbi:S-adenosylmethionine:tRNA ribosyltransferase-isomerase [Borreliella finlandensis]|uniref:S-adenosylmethionine:tRNA ribosyltransferase-isomerase n=1 Tax=Borreliella finlandensis TaxID=498741 RepID=A0A826H2E2_9SPIR|nr:S-adenosylmethionine:tRNA ribosyltransferase-isomerase [Borreliella finlandensis]
MYFKTFLIKDFVAERLQNAKLLGKRILSVVTTALRALGSSYDNNLKKLKRVSKVQIFLFILARTIVLSLLTCFLQIFTHLNLLF